MADPNFHEHWPRRRDGRCKQIIGYYICGLPADAPGHQRYAAREAERTSENSPSVEPVTRSILETLADDNWDPESDAADGGITALAVLRREAKRILDARF